MKFKLPKNIDFVLNTLLESGHSAYIVGGCVRDLLCGKVPSDYDITTSALPEVTRSLFKKTVDTGIKHGTITVFIDDEPIEVTTFRTEGSYLDSRRPDKVNFVVDVKEDLSRRDFTINAMCYNHREGLIDIFGGLDDIKNGVLRAVGDAKVRFSEDALRILRLFRFAATLGFTIEDKTFKSALSCAPLLEKISSERILSELKKACGGESPKALSPLLECDGLKKYCLEDCDLTIIENLNKKEDLRLFALLNLSSCNLKESLTALKCSNKFTSYCEKMKILSEQPLKDDKVHLKKNLAFAGEEILLDATYYCEAFFDIDMSLQRKTLKTIISKEEPYLISHLDISGEDILNLGFKGNEIGEKLQILLNNVIEHPEQNAREKLIKLISN